MYISFEYDENKSRTNKLKHGIDFEEAKLLWSGRIYEVTSAYLNEPRRLVVGLIHGRHWSVVITQRSMRTIRIISARRAREKEKKIYEEQSRKIY